MEPISRRSFLRRAGTGTAAVGALTAFSGVPALGLSRPRRRPAVHAAGIARPSGLPGDGSLVVHVPDPKSGRLHLMFGTSEVVRNDSDLVERIVRAAR